MPQLQRSPYHPDNTDSIQLDLLVGLRIMEQLGKARPSLHDAYHERENDLIGILNWFSLCLVSDISPPYHDIAVALSAEPGLVTVYISKGSASSPTNDERDNISLFMDTLRRVLFNDLDPASTIQSFLFMLALKTFPAFYQKLLLIGATQENDPRQTFDRFCHLVAVWLQHRPEGETSRGFLDMARSYGRGKERTTDIMVKCVLNLIFLDAVREPEKMTLEEKYVYMTPVLNACTLLTHSTFFNDLVYQHTKFRMSLEVHDVLFLHDLYRRICAVGQYRAGCSLFTYRGIHFLKRVLGKDGIMRLMHGTGGIVVHWINNSNNNNNNNCTQPRKTLHWPVCPSTKVGRILERDTLDLGHLDTEMRKSIEQTEAVVGLWTKGTPVTPILHSELQMIRYLEKHAIDVVGNAIGMNQPPCWACHCYMKKRKPTMTHSRWRMSHTSGRPRGYWLVPPSGDGLAVAHSILQALDRKVEHAVEDYALGCYP